jgi:HEPN domain-containing protein
MTRELFGGVTEQAKAGIHRLEDAQVLAREKRWRGAMYLAGYGVECLLKKKLMEKFQCQRLLELEQELQQRGLLALEATVYTHQLERLLRLAGGLDRIRQNRDAWSRFNLVNRWLPAWRYSPKSVTAEDAQDFIEAVEATMKWIAANV